MDDASNLEDDKNTALMKRILLITLFILSIFIYHYIDEKVTRLDLPKGEIKWSVVKPKNAKMCIPAAFTGEDGKISESLEIEYQAVVIPNGIPALIQEAIDDLLTVVDLGPEE